MKQDTLNMRTNLEDSLPGCHIDDTLFRGRLDGGGGLGTRPPKEIHDMKKH